MKRLFIFLMFGVVAFDAFAQTEEENGDDAAVNQYGVPVDSYPLKAEAQNEIMVLFNNEKGYKFWMDNRIQFDGAHYFNLKNGMLVDGKPTMAGGVSLRRVRMAVKAEVHKNWYGEVDVNFANGIFELEDAYIMFTGLKGFEFRAGNFKEDFSMDQTTTSRYITFMERPMVVSTFAPSRHAGLQANWIQRSWIRASAGVSWQIVDTEDTRYNVTEFNKKGRNMGTNFTGKVVLMPWGADEFKGLHIGYNGSYRHAQKTDDDRDGADATGRGYEGNYFSTRNTTAINRLKFISTEYYGVKYDWLQGFELAGYKDGFRFQSEFITNHSVMDGKKIDLYQKRDENGKRLYDFDGPVANKETKYFYGFYAQASYLFFGGKQRYDVTQSEFTQPKRGKDWGDIELMFRYDFLTLNSQDLYGGSGENFALGVVYHINNNLKMSLNWQYSRNDKYAGNKGKAMIGKDSDGNYTSYTTGPNAAVSDFGVKFHAFQTRLEIAF